MLTFPAYVIQIPLAMRQIPNMSLNPRWVSKAKLKEMFHYASVSIGVGLGDKLKANIFPLIVGVLATPVAVTLFSLPHAAAAISNRRSEHHDRDY